MSGHVLVGVDGSESNRFVVAWAAREADRRHANLRLLHAAPQPSGPLDPAEPELLGQAVGAIEVAEASARRLAPDVGISRELVRGDPADALIEQAADADLVVLGRSEHHGLVSLIDGSLDLHVAGHAPAPITIVAPESARWDGDVVVWLRTDELDRARVELETGFREAAIRRSKLVAMHTWSLPLMPRQEVAIDPDSYMGQVTLELERRLDDKLTRWRERFPDVPVEVLVKHQNPHVALLTASSSAALIVLPAHDDPGRHLRALGSLARDAVENAACPVMVLRAG